MRKFFLLISITLFSISAHSQLWFDLGAKFGFGPTVLNNKNVYSDAKINNRITNGYVIGGKIGMNFGNYSSFTFDFMLSDFRQNMVMSIIDSANQTNGNFDKFFQMRTFDVIVAYRAFGEGSYFEFGPYMSFVQSADGFINPTPADDTYQDGNIRTKIIDKWPGVLLGFGSYFFGSKYFSMIFGIRMKYGLEDIISSVGKEELYPSPYEYEVYEETHPFSLQATVEINYDMGWLNKKPCKVRSKMIMTDFARY